MGAYCITTRARSGNAGTGSVQKEYKPHAHGDDEHTRQWQDIERQALLVRVEDIARSMTSDNDIVMSAAFSTEKTLFCDEKPTALISIFRSVSV
jgi:hypothetical protein